VGQHHLLLRYLGHSLLHSVPASGYRYLFIA
jgi:hypothetical protein